MGFAVDLVRGIYTLLRNTNILLAQWFCHVHSSEQSLCFYFQGVIKSTKEAKSTYMQRSHSLVLLLFPNLQMPDLVYNQCATTQCRCK